jgi:hypothetical protein
MLKYTWIIIYGKEEKTRYLEWRLLVQYIVIPSLPVPCSKPTASFQDPSLPPQPSPISLLPANIVFIYI